MKALTKDPSKVVWVNFLNKAQFIFFLLIQLLVPLFSFQSNSKGDVKPYSYYLFYTIDEKNQLVINFFPWLFLVLFLFYLLIDRDSSFIRWLPLSILPLIFFRYIDTIEKYGHGENYNYNLDPFGIAKLINRLVLWDLGVICLIFSIIVYYLVIVFYIKPRCSDDSLKRKTPQRTIMNTQLPPNNESLSTSSKYLTKESSWSNKTNPLNQNRGVGYSPTNLLFLMILMLFIPIYSVDINAFLSQPAFFVTPFGLLYDLPFLFDFFILIYELLTILILLSFIFSIKKRFLTKNLSRGIFLVWLVVLIVLFPDIIGTHINLFVTYPWLIFPFVIIYSQRKYFFDYAVGLSDETLQQRRVEACKLFRQSLFIFLLFQIISISIIFLNPLFPIVFSDFNSKNSLLNSLVFLRPSLTLVLYPLLLRVLVFDSDSLFNSN